MKHWLVAVLVVLTPAGARGDDELQTHLESLQRRIDDPSNDVSVRERLALEMAATLDRAASTAATPDARRARWTEAVEALDRFTAGNSGHPQARVFEVQAAVYLWARARTWMQAVKVKPADAPAREKAVADLNACLKRLKRVAGESGDAADVFTQNVRYRTAQALADLADVDPANRRAHNTEALGALERPITEPSLQGFADLLRASLLARLGRFDEAQTAVAFAAKAKPAPPEPELVEARLDVLVGKKEFAAALKAVADSRLNPSARTAALCRVRLAQRGEARGPDRVAAESALFAGLNELRRKASPEAVPSLVAAAAAVDEPTPGQQPDAWDLLAEGAAALGDPARAGSLERKGADRAEALNLGERAVGLRLKAGAYFFQAEQYDQADPLLAKVAEDPKAGAVRPRAGLLLALARGRALAAGRPGFSQGDYASALRDQVRRFPDDPSASEARWLLGKLRLAESDRDGALSLWKAIPHGRPRWLESRVEMAAVRQHDLDNQRLNNDREAVARRLADARSFLATSLDEAQGDAEAYELRLASARLELTPGVGNPDEALKSCERLNHDAAGPGQREAARRLTVLAQAFANRWVEAEQGARRETKLSTPAEIFPLIRLIDRGAAEAESDLRSRRLGYLLRLLLAPTQERPETLPAGLRAEARLRVIRALLFSGDDGAARRSFAGWTAPGISAGNDLLRDLAETYIRLDAFELAVDVQRLRVKQTSTGSLPWFDARYGLALALYRSGNTKDALHLVEATAILHPDLGGGELQEKFLRLRHRINATG